MKKQSGFTLIELAIVLVIIGLLLGGVLKGQELINSAKVKNMAADFKNTQVYIYGYQDKYRALPGDHKGVDDVISGATEGTGGTLGNGVIEGAWNEGSDTTESRVFWQHVRLAGLAPGPTALTDPNYQPKNADGGVLGVQSVSGFAGPTGLSGAFVICSAGVLGKFAKQIDTTLDDGNTATGSVRAYATPTPVSGGTGEGGGGSSAGWATSVGGTGEGATQPTLNDSATYNVCMAF